MAEENKEVQSGQSGEGGQDKKDSSRSEDRIKDLVNKLSEQERKYSLEIEDREKKMEKLQKEIEEARFEIDFSNELPKYPHAAQYKEEIKEYMNKGLAVSEATLIVLGKHNKLVTSDQMKKAEVENLSLGGSAPNLKISREKNPEEMTQAERRNALIDLENEGVVGVNDVGFFIKK